MIEYRILGPVQALSNGAELALGAAKQRALLVELLLHADEAVPREHLIDAVWGDDPPPAAANALQVYVHGLRRALGAERIETTGTAYRLRLGGDELDARIAERLVASASEALRGGRLRAAAADARAAVGLFRGEPLADLAGHRAAAHLRELQLSAREVLAEACVESGETDAALRLLRALIAEQPYREHIRALEVLALYRAGRPNDALDAYRACRAQLVDELGIEPGPELQELERRILQHDPSLAAETVRVTSAALPGPPTPLIGRRLEVAAVSALLRTHEGRLVTLTGPGGTGKTRLALAVAAEAGDATFVELAAVTDSPRVLGAIARALGVPDREVASALAEPQLLVLDNFEQVLDAAPDVAALLAAAPRLRVLVTSRAPLRIQAEREYAVAPLPVPGGRDSFEDVVSSDAVRLFLERARAVDPGLTIDDEAARSVGAICRRLDGLPLAIELAAARSRVLSLSALAAGIERSLDLIGEGARDLPARQRTLEATLDWSTRLLAPREQEALRRLSVFVDGWTLDAAQSVVGPDCVPLLATLVEHSLVRRSGERLSLLVTIREFAAKQLVQSGEESRFRDLHAQYYLELARRVEAVTAPGGDAEAPYRELDQEHGNIRAAIAWLDQSDELAAAVDLAAAVRPYWVVRGNLGEGRRVFRALIARTANAEATVHIKALLHGASFAYRQGDVDSARAEWEEALELARAAGHDEFVAWATAELGAVAFSDGDLDLADEMYREAAASFEATGNVVRLSIAISNLGAIAEMQHRFADAVEHSERALTLQREINEVEGLAISLQNIARAYLGLGDEERAQTMLAESIAIGQRLQYRELLAYALVTAGELAFAHGDRARAGTLLFAGEAAFDELGAALQGQELEAFNRITEALRDELGEERLAELRRSVPELAEAVELALAVEHGR